VYCYFLEIKCSNSSLRNLLYEVKLVNSSLLKGKNLTNLFLFSFFHSPSFFHHLIIHQNTKYHSYMYAYLICLPFCNTTILFGNSLQKLSFVPSVETVIMSTVARQINHTNHTLCDITMKD
jgi:hypothetical protein